MNKDQLRESILGTAAWKQVGLEVMNESTEVKSEEVAEEVAEEATEEVIEEEAEGHSCPLCSSVLDEEVSDEALLEHADAMLDVFQEAEQVINEQEAEKEGEDLLEGLDEEDLDDLIEKAQARKSNLA